LLQDGTVTALYGLAFALKQLVLPTQSIERTLTGKTGAHP
jgi:hypothetical protein